MSAPASSSQPVADAVPANAAASDATSNANKHTPNHKKRDNKQRSKNTQSADGTPSKQERKQKGADKKRNADGKNRNKSNPHATAIDGQPSVGSISTSASSSKPSASATSAAAAPLPSNSPLTPELIQLLKTTHEEFTKSLMHLSDDLGIKSHFSSSTPALSPEKIRDAIADLLHKWMDSPFKNLVILPVISNGNAVQNSAADVGSSSDASAAAATVDGKIFHASEKLVHRLKLRNSDSLLLLRQSSDQGRIHTVHGVLLLSLAEMWEKKMWKDSSYFSLSDTPSTESFLEQASLLVPLLNDFAQQLTKLIDATPVEEKSLVMSWKSLRNKITPLVSRLEQMEKMPMEVWKQCQAIQDTAKLLEQVFEKRTHNSNTVSSSSSSSSSTSSAAQPAATVADLDRIYEQAFVNFQNLFVFNETIHRPDKITAFSQIFQKKLHWEFEHIMTRLFNNNFTSYFLGPAVGADQTKAAEYEIRRDGWQALLFERLERDVLFRPYKKDFAIWKHKFHQLQKKQQESKSAAAGVPIADAIDSIPLQSLSINPTTHSSSHTVVPASPTRPPKIRNASMTPISSHTLPAAAVSSTILASGSKPPIISARAFSTSSNNTVRHPQSHTPVRSRSPSTVGGASVAVAATPGVKGKDAEHNEASDEEWAEEEEDDEENDEDSIDSEDQGDVLEDELNLSSSLPSQKDKQFPPSADAFKHDFSFFLASPKLMNLNRELESLYASRALSAADLSARETLLVRLNGLVQGVDPSLAAAVFGSSASGSATRGSDMDVSIVRRGSGLPFESASPVLMKRILNSIRKSGQFVNIQPVLRARVPILKFDDRRSGVAVDLAMGQESTAYKSILMRAYSNYDPRVTPLVAAVKTWAKAHDLNDASRNTLNSFGYALLVIQFLQMLHPAILPPLQQPEEGGSSDLSHGKGKLNNVTPSLKFMRDFHVRDPALEHFNALPPTQKMWMRDSATSPSPSPSPPAHALAFQGLKPSLGELLLGFFYFYSHLFDASTMAVCVRIGSLVHKSPYLRPGFKPRTGRTVLLIMDPFDIGDNVARGIAEDVWRTIHQEMKRALAGLVATGSFDEICQPLPAVSKRKARFAKRKEARVAAKTQQQQQHQQPQLHQQSGHTTAAAHTANLIAIAKANQTGSNAARDAENVRLRMQREELQSAVMSDHNDTFASSHRGSNQNSQRGHGQASRVAHVADAPPSVGNHRERRKAQRAQLQQQHQQQQQHQPQHRQQHQQQQQQASRPQSRNATHDVDQQPQPSPIAGNNAPPKHRHRGNNTRNNSESAHRSNFDGQPPRPQSSRPATATSSDNKQ